jgi:hypothetical protein
MRTLAAIWQNFRDTLIPPTAPPIQFHEMRNAYYAGAAAMHHLSMQAVESEDDAACLRNMDALYAELKAFEAEVRARTEAVSKGTA